MDDHQLFRDIKGQASDAERRRILAWRQSSSANESRYQDLRRVLDATRASMRIETSPPPVLDILKVAASRERLLPRSPWVRRSALIAAGLAAVAVLSFGVDRLRNRGDFGLEEMVTGDQQPVTVALRDGSVMRLAPRSKARIRVRDGLREVHLTGRAFFSVAKRDGLPFVVKTAGGDVTVLGTQFDVDASDANVRLVVVEGKVAMTAARGGATNVTRGQRVRIVEGQLLPTETVKELLDETRWVGRFLSFRDTPLTEVAHEIARAYGVKVTIADSTLASHTVTDWFSDRSLDDVVHVVCAIVAAECSVKDNEVVLGRSPR